MVTSKHLINIDAPTVRGIRTLHRSGQYQPESYYSTSRPHQESTIHGAETRNISRLR